MIVSVTVISYNSSATVVETLDSILHQDYDTQKIELIIADDASTDNCIEIIDGWLANHKDAFYDVNVFQNPVNLGISGNCNSAWKAATCDWIKPIAADDMLMSNCISDNVMFVKNNPDCKVVFSKMQWFGSVEKITPTPYDLKFFDINHQKQNSWLKVFSFNIAPSAFINKSVLDQVGYADESLRNIEDLPLWLKITHAGYKLYFLDKVTVKYRAAESTSMSDHRYVNIKFLKDLIKINKSQEKPFFKAPIDEIVRQEQLLLFNLTLIIAVMTGNKKNQLSMLLGRSTWALRPIHAMHQFKYKRYNAKKDTTY